jgi:hypothetical protein
MPNPPHIQYFLYHHTRPVRENDDIWNVPLPMSRTGSVSPGSVTYGDYFCAIRNFLEKNQFEPLRTAISLCISRSPDPADIKDIKICLEKHGEFYHPSRIECLVAGSELSFVLNAAVSDTGKNLVKKECEHLKQLDENFPVSFVPKVYAAGEGRTGTGFEIPMFLGEWFDGYNEFHISEDPSDKTHKIRVWDPEKGAFFLSAEKAEALYRQAAMILTCYYDFETFEEIYPWHHAAGDFVVKFDKNRADLRLVTVRGYGSRFENQDADPSAIPGAMLVFLLNLSIWMRLDRLDGTGDVVWADDISVGATVKGFFQALEARLPDELVGYFRNYLASHSVSDLHDLAESIARIFPPRSPERPVIKNHLKKHIAMLHRFIGSY